MRTHGDDAVAVWKEHFDDLERRADYLNNHHFRRLHYRSPGTDLHIELPPMHLWSAARARNARGDGFAANLPTEEVYTLPSRGGAEGTVRATMPLVYHGVVIEGIELKFQGGRVVDFRSSTAYETLKQLVETDEGSHYLGEVALVPVTSPIAQEGRLFYSTLFDENASCHLAIGHAYPTCLVGGRDMSEAELAEAGLNDSITHVDFMIGSSEMDIDGETDQGEIVPVMRQGLWAF
jgi:aminopeptidase